MMNAQFNQSLPLYGDLLNTVKKNKESQFVDIKKVCQTVKTMGSYLTKEELKEHYDIIYALILHHDALQNRGKSLSVSPYQTRILNGGKGIIVMFPSLPVTLQRIVAQYIHECSDTGVGE